MRPDTANECYTKSYQIKTSGVTSAARERAKRAKRAKRWVETIRSNEQQETVTRNQMQQQITTGCFIISRFPFIYQTGFEGGPNGVFFRYRFLDRFLIDFGGRFGTFFRSFCIIFFITFSTFFVIDFHCFLFICWHPRFFKSIVFSGENS